MTVESEGTMRHCATVMSCFASDHVGASPRASQNSNDMSQYSPCPSVFSIDLNLSILRAGSTYSIVIFTDFPRKDPQSVTDTEVTIAKGGAKIPKRRTQDSQSANGTYIVCV